jgi:hypothetical protein
MGRGWKSDCFLCTCKRMGRFFIELFSKSDYSDGVRVLNLSDSIQGLPPPCSFPRSMLIEPLDAFQNAESEYIFQR